MKKLFTIVLVLMLSLMVVGSVFANGPEEPVCPKGMITVTPAEWVSRECSCAEGVLVINKCVVTDTIPQTVVDGHYGEWGEWSRCKSGSTCDTPTCMDRECGSSGNHQHRHRVWIEEAYTCPEGYSGPDGGICTKITKTKADCVPGYWIDPVCEKPAPDEVIVGVGLRCSGKAGETVYQLMGGVTVNPTGGATLTLDGIDYTASQSLHIGFGSYDWSAVAKPGFNILGDNHGTIKISRSDCNEPLAHLRTGASGEPINLSLAILMGLIGVSALTAGVIVTKRVRQ